MMREIQLAVGRAVETDAGNGSKSNRQPGGAAAVDRVN